MARSLRPWQRVDDADLRIAEAHAFIEQLDAVTSTEVWQHIMAGIDDEISQRTHQLVMSSRDDERNRGAIEALQWIKDLPVNSKNAAQDVIETGATHG